MEIGHSVYYVVWNCVLSWTRAFIGGPRVVKTRWSRFGKVFQEMLILLSRRLRSLKAISLEAERQPAILSLVSEA